MISLVRVASVAAILCAASLSSAMADDAFYYGKWKITESAAAPWVLPGDVLEPSEMKGFIGKTITIGAAGIDGPGDFPCKNPQYQVLEGGPEMLYQGSFENMHAQDQSVDMQKLAEKTGLTGTHFRTIVTGCEYEVDFSFGADNDTAKFALNNAIYTLKRE